MQHRPYEPTDDEEFWMYYETWCRKNMQEMTEEELNLMERDSKESLTVSNRIIAQIPLNNINFYPKQGA